jgi:hypothetical protein
MHASLPRAALLACLAAAAFAMPAGASPKSDCEEGLAKAEARFNAGVNRGAVDKVRKSINNARAFRDQGKFKKCAELAATINKQLGAN